MNTIFIPDAETLGSKFSPRDVSTAAPLPFACITYTCRVPPRLLVNAIRPFAPEATAPAGTAGGARRVATATAAMRDAAAHVRVRMWGFLSDCGLAGPSSVASRPVNQKARRPNHHIRRIPRRKAYAALSPNPSNDAGVEAVAI